MLKEIVDPKGARFELRAIPVGDPTLSALEVNTPCLHPCVSIQHCALKGAPTASITLLLLSHTNPLPVIFPSSLLPNFSLTLPSSPLTPPLHSPFPLLPPLPPPSYRSGVQNTKRTMLSSWPLKTCQSSWQWARERTALSVL